MTNVFTLEKNEDFSEQLNIDDLYETKHKDDLNKLELFNKILNRIHVKIKTVSNGFRLIFKSNCCSGKSPPAGNDRVGLSSRD